MATRLEIFQEAPDAFTPLRVMDAEGQRVAELPDEPQAEELLALFRWIVFGRVFDSRMIGLQRQGRIGTIGSIRGQEGAQAGAALAMAQEDWLVGSYRELLLYAIRGVPVETIISLYKGRTPGPFPPGVRALPIQIVIGAQLPHATGLALAAQYRGDASVVLACCGDGATSEGDFHEGLNFAGVYRAPVVFFVQNNGWAISVPRARQTAARTIAHKAWAYGLPGAVVDGNDPVAVMSVLRAAFAHARSGQGPVLVEALTYRLGPHTTSDDPRRYRAEEEVQRHEHEDPLPRLRRFLERNGLYREGLQEEYEEAARQEMARAIAAVEEAPAFTPEEMFRLTYANPPAGWLAARDRVLAELRAIGGHEA
jgi:pyruvate dehydrogenase E1 component alpha subunit